MPRKRILTVAVTAFTLLAMFALAPTRSAQGFKKLTMEVTFAQEGAPVQLGSVTHGVDFLLSRAEVKNVSDRTIRSVTFGVLLHEAGPIRGESILAASREIQTDIKPGSVRTLDVLALSLKESQEKAAHLKTNPAIAEFGILGVQYEDGGSWTFDAQKVGTFASAKPLASIGSFANPSSKVNCKTTMYQQVVATLENIKIGRASC